MTDAEMLRNAILQVSNMIEGDSYGHDISDALTSIGQWLRGIHHQLAVQNQLHALQIKVNAPFNNDEQLDTITKSIEEIMREV